MTTQSSEAESSQSIPKEITLMPNEKVLMVLKRCYISFITLATIGLIILWIIVGIVSFFTPVGWSEYLYLLYVFAFAILPVLLYGLGYFYVKGHLYIITNERTIMFRKFIGILMRTVTHDKITDILVNQGPFGRVFNYGRIAPITAGVIMPMGAMFVSLSGVRNPYEARDKIAELVKATSPRVS